MRENSPLVRMGKQRHSLGIKSYSSPGRRELESCSPPQSLYDSGTPCKNSLHCKKNANPNKITGGQSLFCRGMDHRAYAKQMRKHYWLKNRGMSSDGTGENDDWDSIWGVAVREGAESLLILLLQMVFKWFTIRIIILSWFNLQKSHFGWRPSIESCD